MIEILNAGFYSTIQDLGRFGFRNQGVPISGVMDSISAKMANSLLGNPLTDAVLEIALTGPKLLFTVNTCIALTGANRSPKLNDVPVSNGKLISVKSGDLLSFGKLIEGVRTYMAVMGGIQSELKLNSRSQFKSLTKSVQIKRGEKLIIKGIKDQRQKSGAHINSRIPFYRGSLLNVMKGPELERFTEDEIESFLQTSLTISRDNNRMGIRFKEVLKPHNHSMLTSPVLPGTIQLLPSGRIIVLMRDAQTTGGYPRIFQLSEMAISILAQKKEGDTIQLTLKN